MIGQGFLKEEIDKAICNGFPRFSIIIGPQGSGKKLIVDYISEKTGFEKIACSNKVDDVREIIREAYNQTDDIIYVFFDADEMSNNAKNALLKITEEPPNNAYFIMTISSENKTLDTILSRGTQFKLSGYSFKELSEYIKTVYPNTKLNIDDLVSIADVPGDINTLIGYDFEQFFSFCNQVVDNIATVDENNALKIVEKLAVKDEGWDIKLFLSAIRFIFLKAQIEDGYSSYGAIKVCSDYINQLSNKSLNKRMLCDNWIFDLRESLNGTF